MYISAIILFYYINTQLYRTIINHTHFNNIIYNQNVTAIVKLRSFQIKWTTPISQLFLSPKRFPINIFSVNEMNQNQVSLKYQILGI